MHKDIIIQALNAAIDVFNEKPIEESLEIIERKRIVRKDAHDTCEKLKKQLLIEIKKHDIEIGEGEEKYKQKVCEVLDKAITALSSDNRCMAMLLCVDLLHKLKVEINGAQG